ncbi:MAG: MotA/TolQ/ExbB proton channel family protein [Planctomycetes bacterium]|nr:MotA/TolQ/ExbB proton channel family protein [Planctomycetota bacterium]
MEALNGALAVIDLGTHFARGGPLMWPLLALSVATAGLVLERLWFFRRELLCAVCGLRRSGDRLAVLDPQRVPWEGHARSRDAVARVLAAWHLRGEAAARIEGEESLARANQGLLALDTLTQLSTNLGLLGTVVGVLGVFPHYLSGHREGVIENLSVALYTTVLGLLVFLYGFFFQRLFQGLVERLARRLDLAGENLRAEAGSSSS